MENDQGTRRLPASDGPLKEFLGGARRCAERATKFSAGQSGGSPSGELGRLILHTDVYVCSISSITSVISNKYFIHGGLCI